MSGDACDARVPYTAPSRKGEKRSAAATRRSAAFVKDTANTKLVLSLCGRLAVIRNLCVCAYLVCVAQVMIIGVRVLYTSRAPQSPP